MKIIAILLAGSCIISGSVERQPSYARSSANPVALEARGASSVIATMSGPLDTTPFGLVIFVR